MPDMRKAAPGASPAHPAGSHSRRMWEEAADVAAAIERALGDVAGALAGAAPAWLALGVVLHLANQALRARGWLAIVRAATGSDVRAKDAVTAWVAGAGAGGLLSARGGDAVRVLLLRPRVRCDGWPVLAGTLVAESAGEAFGGAMLLGLALALGVAPALGAPGGAAVWALLAVTCAVVGAALLVRRSGRCRCFAARVGRGCVLLRRPGRYAREVLPWQAASRACRAASLGCFLLAFGLPAVPAAILLVMAAQGGGRLLPFGPAAVGAGAAMLAAAFEPVTGRAVPAADLAAFFVGMTTALTVVGACLTAAICVRAARWDVVVDAVRIVRRRPVRATTS